MKSLHKLLGMQKPKFKFSQGDRIVNPESKMSYCVGQIIKAEEISKEFRCLSKYDEFYYILDMIDGSFWAVSTKECDKLFIVWDDRIHTHVEYDKQAIYAG